MKRKEQLLIWGQHKVKGSACSLRFVFLFLVLNQLSFAQNSKYDLNDPRNPDCPCHKLQKQAEEEYAQQNNKQNYLKHEEVRGENKNSDFKKNILVSSNQLRSVNNSQYIMTNGSKHRKKLTWIKKLKFRYFKRIGKIKHIHPDYSVCYKW